MNDDLYIELSHHTGKRAKRWKGMSKTVICKMKRRYPCIEDAEYKAKRYGQHPYFCHICEGYHLSTRKLRKKK